MLPRWNTAQQSVRIDRASTTESELSARGAVDLAPFWQARSTPATAQAKEEDRDDRVSDRYRGGSGQSRGLVMHEAEEGEPAPDKAKAEASTNFFSMTNTPMASSTKPVRTEPPPRTSRP
jgi:hypothetical protein